MVELQKITKDKKFDFRGLAQHLMIDRRDNLISTIETWAIAADKVDAVYAKSMRGGFHLFVYAKEHYDCVYGAIEELENSLYDQGHSVYFTVRAHQGRDFSELPPGFKFCLFRKG